MWDPPPSRSQVAPKSCRRAATRWPGRLGSHVRGAVRQLIQQPVDWSRMRRFQVALTGLHAVGPGGQPRSALPSGFTESKVLRSLFRILEATTLCSLATVSPDCVAHISHVYFAHSRDLHLYFLSDPRSGHCRHLIANPTMAVSVCDSAQQWGGPDCGIALYGTCREARGRGATLAAQVYGRRFQAYEEWRATLPPRDEAMRWRFYVFDASRVKVFDETQLGSGIFAVASIRR